jgi:hypothetical protein
MSMWVQSNGMIHLILIFRLIEFMANRDSFFLMADKIFLLLVFNFRSSGGISC